MQDSLLPEYGSKKHPAGNGTKKQVEAGSTDTEGSSIGNPGPDTAKSEVSEGTTGTRLPDRDHQVTRGGRGPALKHTCTLNLTSITRAPQSAYIARFRASA